MQTISAVICFALLALLSVEQVSGDVHRASHKDTIDCLVKKQCMNPVERKLRKNVTNKHPGYTKDTWNVYFEGKKIEHASPVSFTIFSDGYAKDNWNVYFKGEIIKGASSASFVPLTHGYAKDNWSVYYNGAIMKGASPQTFALSHG